MNNRAQRVGDEQIHDRKPFFRKQYFTLCSCLTGTVLQEKAADLAVCCGDLSNTGVWIQHSPKDRNDNEKTDG